MKDILRARKEKTKTEDTLNNCVSRDTTVSKGENRNVEKETIVQQAAAEEYRFQMDMNRYHHQQR